MRSCCNVVFTDTLSTARTILRKSEERGVMHAAQPGSSGSTPTMSNHQRNIESLQTTSGNEEVSRLRSVREQTGPLADRGSLVRCIKLASVVAVFAALACQAHYVTRWAVDVPRTDEWYLFDLSIPHFEPIPSLEYLLSSNGSHRIFFARILYAILYFADGMNFAHIKLVNYIFFSAIVLMFAGLKDQTIGSEKFPLFPLFLVFLFSPINVENHTWAYQSQIHFSIFFQLLAVYFGFRENRRGRDDASFLSACACAMYSFSSGIAVSVVLTGALVVRSFLQWITGEGAWPFLRSLAVSVLLAGIIYAWMLDAPQSGASVALIEEANFWKFVLNLLSLGHGFAKSLSLVPGILVLLNLFVPTLILVCSSEARKSSTSWMWLTLAWSAVAGLLAIALGRYGDYGGHYESAKTSRYSELSFVIIPAIAALWYLSLRARPLMRTAMLCGYFGFLLAGFGASWDYSSYQNIAEGQIRAQQLIETYYSGESRDAMFPFIFPHPLKGELDYATRLRIHFAEEMARRYGREDLLRSDEPT